MREKRMRAAANQAVSYRNYRRARDRALTRLAQAYPDDYKELLEQEKAIDETNRRRAKQVAYNAERGVDPQPLRKKIADITDLINRESDDTQELLATAGVNKAKVSGIAISAHQASTLPRQELLALIESLTAQMRSAAQDLQFELAARFRDEIRDLKKELRAMEIGGL